MRPAVRAEGSPGRSARGLLLAGVRAGGGRAGLVEGADVMKIPALFHTPRKLSKRSRFVRIPPAVRATRCGWAWRRLAGAVVLQAVEDWHGSTCGLIAARDRARVREDAARFLFGAADGGFEVWAAIAGINAGAVRRALASEAGLSVGVLRAAAEAGTRARRRVAA